jgi:hypothetical protein
MQEFAGKPVRALVVWEPVLATDWLSPSTMTLSRLSDTRAAQFWDKGRLVSRSLGEHDRRSIVWDYIAVYPPGTLWEDHAPEAPYHGGPVVQVAEVARASVTQALLGIPQRVH